MKASIHLLSAAIAGVFLLASCEAFVSERPQGRLFLRFLGGSFPVTRTASSEIPDTNDFILTLTDSDGNEVFNGRYGDSPVSFSLPPGSYTVSAVSCDFKAPRFSAPQFGDRQVVLVSSGEDCYADLVCRQLNSGVKLNIAPDFLTSFPNGTLLLKNADGKLLYGYKEKRIAYFNPGSVSLVLSNGGTDETVFTRVLESREILVLNISAPSGASRSASGIKVAVDTSRLWISEDFTLGQGSPGGSDISDAYSVSQARSEPGAEDVWVCGYIVGGDLSSSSASFSPPFKSRTNIVLGTRSSVTDREMCLSVQLQKGDIRDALNLVDNPDILGRYVWLRGDVVEAYYGMPGIRNITEYRFKDD